MKFPKIRVPKLSRKQAILAGGVVLLLVGGSAVVFRGSSEGAKQWTKEAAAQAIFAPVVTSPFTQEVVERGEVQSSRNVEVRCQVAARGQAGVAIIQIVPEGTVVKEGDFLIKLDDSQLQTDLNTQQIAANSSRALMVEAQSDYESAKLALNEYINGPFRQDEQALESDLFVAKEDLRRAEEYKRYSQNLAARGYVTEVQLEADRFAVEKARKALDVVQTKLDVLRNYTKVKTLKQLNASLETAEARLRTRENVHNLDNERLAQIKDYIAKCSVTAPCAGQVVYANDGPQAANGEPLIAEGKLVRERQIMVRLPDPTKMRVLARVNEARIDLVKKGMLAKVTVDAFPDTQLEGVVQTVGEYPMQNLIPYSTVKEYSAEIEIANPPQALRSGMTAKAAIEVSALDEALQVPVQAVMEREDRHYCLLPGMNGQIEAREVELGPANDITVVVKSGLQVNEQVLLAPQNYESYVTFPVAPEISPAPQATVAAVN